mmetsp:Transcript_21143/g.34882  ORF Transcript_21143/g.34882 Transcript_21143/m.34882 type:complete len:204 (+) Transcript_21143:541-1152(+)
MGRQVHSEAFEEPKSRDGRIEAGGEERMCQRVGRCEIDCKADSRAHFCRIHPCHGPPKCTDDFRLVDLERRPCIPQWLQSEGACVEPRTEIDKLEALWPGAAAARKLRQPVVDELSPDRNPPHVILRPRHLRAHLGREVGPRGPAKLRCKRIREECVLPCALHGAFRSNPAGGEGDASELVVAAFLEELLKIFGCSFRERTIR